ncbi:MAG: peptidase M28, partial [Deltaproteobacteria bacterium]
MSSDQTQAVTLTAAYDTTLKAPACRSQASSCDSGTLLLGRWTVGPEPNAPNTIHSDCWDGTLGSYHTTESIDRLAVSSLDGGPLTTGSTVRIDATVWASSVTSDRLDL